MKNELFICLMCCGLTGAAAAELKGYAAARHIRAGEAITPEALRELPDASEGTLAPEELTGCEAARPIRAGETVTRLMLRPVRAVRAGEKIRVRSSAGRVSVEAWFTALGSGAKGEIIEARNTAGGRICRVRIEGPGEGVLAGEGK